MKLNIDCCIHCSLDIPAPRTAFCVCPQVSLVVNVASECGFTDKHYKGLVRLQSLLSETGVFTILAFPCNQFAGQEPNVGGKTGSVNNEVIL